MSHTTEKVGPWPASRSAEPSTTLTGRGPYAVDCRSTQRRAPAVRSSVDWQQNRSQHPPWCAELARLIWFARALTLSGIASLILWVIFREHLPWWASALMLAGAAIAPMEAVTAARKAGRPEDPDQQCRDCRGPQ